jgi:hypothetical protein
MSSAVKPVSMYQYGTGQRASSRSVQARSGRSAYWSQVHVPARQRDNHQRGRAQRVDLGPLLSLTFAEGGGVVVEHLPQRGRLLGARQDQERVALAESRRRGPVGRPQQPLRRALGQWFRRERADHLAPLDDLAEFHLLSLVR